MKAARTVDQAATILVAEDDQMVCALVHEVLASCGYSVISSLNGAEALDIVASYCGSLELLLTDIVLPRISGRQLAENAATIRPCMKTLYMSGYPEPSLRSMGWPHWPYLQKPFTPEQLLVRVRGILAAVPQGLPCP